MKAVMFSDRRDYELVDRPEPEAREGTVLLRVELCGICGTDLHAPQLEDLFTGPVVLGHEFTAAVAAVGPGVADLVDGDRGVVNPIGLVCGRCDPCLAGFTNMCEQALTVDCCGVGKDGGMAEYVAVEAAHLHRIDDSLSSEVGAWTEPLAVAVRGVRRAGIRLGDRIAILGVGPIGQLVLQAALAAGAGEAVAVDPSPYRRRVAHECGAESVLSPEEAEQEDPSFDVVIDCTGAPPALDTAVSLVGAGGHVVVIGTYSSPPTLAASLRAHLKEVTITFSMCYQDGEFDTALGLLDRGAIDVRPLTTRISGIQQYAAAFEEMAEGDEVIKILLSPGR